VEFFCKKCSKPISYNPEKTGKGFCSSCGQQKSETWRFCIDCGKRIFKYKGKRCRPCFNKWHVGKNVGGYKHGKTNSTKCIECGILLKNFQAQRCPTCWYKYAVGKNAPNYIDGGSIQKYPKEFTRKLREEIRKDKNYTCQICNMTEEEHIIVYGQSLSVHHIDYKKENCSKSNLTVLCIGCNNRVNYNKRYWINYFQTKINCKSGV
jgi:hypothetical protein